MSKRLWITSLVFLVIAATVGGIFIPNPVGKKILMEAKYRGYLPYTPDDAVSLAYSRCTTCHDEQKMLKYCSQCGPPFIIVSQTMKKYVALSNQKGAKIRPFSGPELVAITQAWNAMVGNWEPNWGVKDITTLLKGDAALVRLAETPLKKRPIEVALKGRSAPGSYKRIYTFDPSKNSK